MPVHYGDLDLSTPKGRHRLEVRLQRSAAMVCGRDDGTAPQFGDDDVRRCYDKALRQAHVALAAKLAPDRLASRQ
jgi:UrcA family protein